MTVSLKEVENIAKLAKLSFDQEEMEKFAEQFNQILEYIDKLNELDTESVQPTYHVLDLTNVMREDEAKPGLTQEEALSNAPKKKAGLFSVPKVIG